MTVFGQIARIICLLVFCCGVAVADTLPTTISNVTERHGETGLASQVIGGNRSEDLYSPRHYPFKVYVTRSSADSVVRSRPFVTKALVIEPSITAKAARPAFRLASIGAPIVADASRTAERAGSRFEVPLDQPNESPSTKPLKFASLSRPDRSGNDAPLKEPFDIPAMSTRLGDVGGKWADLQPRVLADQKILATCRAAASKCSNAARRFWSIIEDGRQHQGRARIGWINRAVNLSIRPVSDWEQYGYSDYWASPLQTLSSGTGDCEDYAIVKYVALRELGVAPEDIRLVIVRENMRQEVHAVVAVRSEHKWLILDSRTMLMLEAEQERQYEPMFVMDYRGVRQFIRAASRL